MHGAVRPSLVKRATRHGLRARSTGHFPDWVVTDLNALDTYLGLNYVPGAHTLAAGVLKLLPGHFLTWHDGEISSHCYWQAKPQDFGALPTLEDSTARLDQLLRQSVKEHLTADVPVGIWLSGGIDSSTVLHYASQQASTQLKTFSITFNGREFDEAWESGAVCIGSPERCRGVVQKYADAGVDQLILMMQVGRVPHQSARAWAGRAKADQAAILFGDPATLAAGAMRKRAGQQIDERHTPTLRLDAWPVVSGDLAAAGPALKRGKRHHVDGAERAD